jgi:ribosomal protein S18 acetylase RimI-like enzyme
VTRGARVTGPARLTRAARVTRAAGARVTCALVAIEIRPAAEAELAAVADLCVAAYAPFLHGDSGYVAVLGDVARRAADAELLVAAERDGGAVLGTVTFVPDGGPLGEIAGPTESEFRMLAVDPSAQGRGVGTALLRRVVDDSGRRGKAAVVCSSQPAMRAAHRVYERLGFRRAPERDWSPIPGIDLLVFTLPLPRERASMIAGAGRAGP